MNKRGVTFAPPAEEGGAEPPKHARPADKLAPPPAREETARKTKM